MSVQPKPYLTPQEYLALERQAQTKSEYFAGEVFALAGASKNHSAIVPNLSYLLVGQLKGRPCAVHTSDMRVKVSPTGLYTYPDVVVVCGKLRFDDEREDTLLNPTVIIEVLSKATEAYDRGQKFAHFRTLESLSDYLLVAQDVASIEHYVRQPDGSWLFTESSGLESTAVIDSIQCQLSLAEVYDKVDLATPSRTSWPAVVKEPAADYTLSMNAVRPSSADSQQLISMQAIRAIAAQIAERFQPEEIVLFGSYAYGVPKPESDVDLLVIMNTSLRSRQQRLEISRALSPRPFPLDIIVRTPQEIEERTAMGDPFLREITTRGKVVYERPGD